MPSVIYHIRGLNRAVGFAKTGEILIRRALKSRKVAVVKVRNYVVEVRPTNSDLFVLSQIFGWQEYSIDPGRLATLRDVAAQWRAAGVTPLIIDAGANVGYSSLYFADLFPNATVLAIEPDRSSYEILARHAKAKSNITALHAALWSHEKGLALQTSSNGSWGSFVTEGGGTPSARLDTLVATIPKAKALLVKLDIEGAEREVVESSPEIFLDAKCIMVEPHDFKYPAAGSLFPLFKVLANKRFDTLISGENLQFFALDQKRML